MTAYITDTLGRDMTKHITHTHTPHPTHTHCGKKDNFTKIHRGDEMSYRTYCILHSFIFGFSSTITLMEQKTV